MFSEHHMEELTKSIRELACAIRDSTHSRIDAERIRRIRIKSDHLAKAMVLLAKAANATV